MGNNLKKFDKVVVSLVTMERGGANYYAAFSGSILHEVDRRSGPTRRVSEILRISNINYGLFHRHRNVSDY